MQAQRGKMTTINLCEKQRKVAAFNLCNVQAQEKKTIAQI